jgi:hypothetical protein
MRRECRLLLAEAKDSLLLSIEIFNRPTDVGRKTASLILLDHAFEMLLKAGIIQRGGKIRRPRERNTLGFNECVRKALNDGAVKFLTEEQALVLQTTNLLRDASYHHILDISEQHLYMQAQASMALFRDILSQVFGQELYDALPKRVLPLSTTPPTDLAALFENEVAEIAKLMRAGRRRRTEATAKARALAITENAVSGSSSLPTESELQGILRDVGSGKSWSDLFPGVASIEVICTGTGPSLTIRWTKREGVPIQTVPEGTPGATVVAVRRVNELDFWNLGRNDVAKKIGLSGPKTTTLIRFLHLQEDEDCFKRLTIGKSSFDRYSQTAVTKCREALESIDIEDVWKAHGGSSLVSI